MSCFKNIGRPYIVPFILQLFIIDNAERSLPRRKQPIIRIIEPSDYLPIIDAFSTKISDCANDFADWARSNRLMLNPKNNPRPSGAQQWAVELLAS